MTDYMICQNQDNHLLYALKHGRFWFWDKHQNKWVPSDFAAQQYAKALTEEPDLAQEDWLGRCFGILMDDYEVPDAVVKALRALSNLERAVHLMQCACVQVARFMQHGGAHLAHGMQTLEVQHNSVVLPVPHRTGCPRQHCERHNIHIILFAISVKVGQLKHWIYSSCFFLARRSRITLTISRSTALSSSESSLYSP